MNTSDRSDAIAAAAVILADKDAVFLKVETTGLDVRAEVVEIAVIHALSGDVLLNTLVKPSRPYALHSKLLHGIAYDTLADAPAITSLRLVTLLHNKKVIVYGKDFAQKMIRQSHEANGVGFHPQCSWHDVMTLYGAFEGIENDYGTGYKWWRFDDACENLHVNNSKRNHRALEEAKTIGLLLYQISTRGEAVTTKRDPLPRPVLDLDEE